MRRYALDESTATTSAQRSFTTGEVQPFRSDYYTGEAIFGLLVSARPMPSLPVSQPPSCGAATAFPAKPLDAYAACAAVDRGTVPEAVGSPT